MNMDDPVDRADEVQVADQRLDRDPGTERVAAPRAAHLPGTGGLALAGGGGRFSRNPDRWPAALARGDQHRGLAGERMAAPALDVQRAAAHGAGGHVGADPLDPDHEPSAMRQAWLEPHVAADPASGQHLRGAWLCGGDRAL
jgi:hypothetical protein